MESSAIAVVRNWELHEARGNTRTFNAASLVKQVIAHVALALVDDLDEPVHDGITVRHVVSHTTGIAHSSRPPPTTDASLHTCCASTTHGGNRSGPSMTRSPGVRAGDSNRVEHNQVWIEHFL